MRSTPRPCGITLTAPCRSTRRGTLKPDEVYSLAAFLLFKNGVIAEDQVMDAQTLPKVKMPNRDHAALAPEWKHGAPRLAAIPDSR